MDNAPQFYFEYHNINRRVYSFGKKTRVYPLGFKWGEFKKLITSALREFSLLTIRNNCYSNVIAIFFYAWNEERQLLVQFSFDIAQVEQFVEKFFRERFQCFQERSSYLSLVNSTDTAEGADTSSHVESYLLNELVAWDICKFLGVEEISLNNFLQ